VTLVWRFAIKVLHNNNEQVIVYALFYCGTSWSDLSWKDVFPLSVFMHEDP